MEQDHLAAFAAGCAWCGVLIPAEHRAAGTSPVLSGWTLAYEDGTARIIHVLCPEHAQLIDEFGTAEPTDQGRPDTDPAGAGAQPSEP